MHFILNLPDFKNVIIISAVVGLLMRLQRYLLKRWLDIERSPLRSSILTGLLIGFIVGFRLAHDLKTGLLLSILIIGAQFAIALVGHFVPNKKRPR